MSNGSTAKTGWRSLWDVPEGRWPGVRWGFSLLVPLALMFWLVTWVWGPEEPSMLVIRVESQVTGECLPGALVQVGDIAYRTDAEGAIRVDPVRNGTAVIVTSVGHESLRGDVQDGDGDLTLSLPGVLVMGSISDAITGERVEGAELSVVDDADVVVATSRTDESGSFIFKMIPEDATLHIQHDVYGESVEQIGRVKTLALNLDPPPVTGRVVDAEGRGIEGARVQGPQSEVVTDGGGAFVLEPVGQGTEISIDAGDAGETTLVVEGRDLGEIVVTGTSASPEAGR